MLTLLWYGPFLYLVVSKFHLLKERSWIVTQFQNQTKFGVVSSSNPLQPPVSSQSYSVSIIYNPSKGVCLVNFFKNRVHLIVKCPCPRRDRNPHTNAICTIARRVLCQLIYGVKPHQVRRVCLGSLVIRSSQGNTGIYHERDKKILNLEFAQEGLGGKIM